jgi:hypothetical protein
VNACVDASQDTQGYDREVAASPTVRCTLFQRETVIQFVAVRAKVPDDEQDIELNELWYAQLLIAGTLETENPDKDEQSSDAVRPALWSVGTLPRDAFAPVDPHPLIVNSHPHCAQVAFVRWLEPDQAEENETFLPR